MNNQNLNEKGQPSLRYALALNGAELIALSGLQENARTTIRFAFGRSVRRGERGRYSHASACRRCVDRATLAFARCGGAAVAGRRFNER
jgi:hypothetical protein